jgi:hypothetical protein
MEEEIEAIKAVSSINSDIYEKLGDSAVESGLWLEFVTDGTTSAVTFSGAYRPLWCSDNDERDCDETTDVYEPIAVFLRKRLDQYAKLAALLATE